jgi:hypothetical protein
VHNKRIILYLLILFFGGIQNDIALLYDLISAKKIIAKISNIKGINSSCEYAEHKESCTVVVADLNYKIKDNISDSSQFTLTTLKGHDRDIKSVNYKIGDTINLLHYMKGNTKYLYRNNFFSYVLAFSLIIIKIFICHLAYKAILRFVQHRKQKIAAK